MLAPEAKIFGAAAPRLPNTSCVALAGLPAETQIMALDLAGVAVSSGSACSSGKVQPPHVLAAMGASAEEAGAALRGSLGRASPPAANDCQPGTLGVRDSRERGRKRAGRGQGGWTRVE